MLRRSSRLQNSHAAVELTVELTLAERSPRPLKRARITPTPEPVPAPRRRKAGLLEKFTKEVPLDVCLEVFKCLHPRDLLSLARTSKILRSILMSKSSKLIWRSARENVPDLPPIPPDLNEPQFACMLPVTTWHGAPGYGVATSAYLPRMCVYDWFTAHTLIQNQFLFVESGAAARRVVKGSEEYDGDVSAQWDTILPQSYGPSRPFSLSSSSMFFHLGKYGIGYSPAMIQRYFQEYLQVKDDPEECPKWQTNKRKETTASYMVQLQHFCPTVAYIAFSTRIYVEDGTPKLLRTVDKNYKAPEKKGNKIKRLKVLGWDDRYFDAEFLRLPLVRQPKVLTDRIWTNIMPSLVQFLEKKKTANLEHEKKLALAERLRLLGRVYHSFCLKSAEVLPPIGDVMLHFKSEPIHRLLWDARWDKELTETEGSEVLGAVLPQIASSWLQEKERALLALMPLGSTIAQLRSITTIFKCRACSEPLWVPRVYAHRCLTEADYLYPLPQPPFRYEENWDTLDFNPFKMLGWRPWSVQHISFCETGSKYAESIREITGLDKPEDLDRLDPLIECLDCAHGERRLFMRWTNAIAHGSENHRFSVTSYDEHIKRRVLREQGPHPRVHPYQRTLRCKMCTSPGLRTIHQDIRLHLKWIHDIEEVHQTSDHWFSDIRTPFSFLYPPDFWYSPS
ncbi:hypothetical protein VNI00_013988 [Paramarasmius palmivorus]|uniref:F-box domain-containing protein n=1 Tax=Paramarasmius palmivorus TaxID=297713 RepID=A0AAW0BW43_9AGAR